MLRSFQDRLLKLRRKSVKVFAESADTYHERLIFFGICHCINDLFAGDTRYLKLHAAFFKKCTNKWLENEGKMLFRESDVCYGCADYLIKPKLADGIKKRCRAFVVVSVDRAERVAKRCIRRTSVGGGGDIFSCGGVCCELIGNGIEFTSGIAFSLIECICYIRDEHSSDCVSDIIIDGLFDHGKRLDNVSDAKMIVEIATNIHFLPQKEE